MFFVSMAKLTIWDSIVVIRESVAILSHRRLVDCCAAPRNDEENQRVAGGEGSMVVRVSSLSYKAISRTEANSQRQEKY